MPDSAPEVKERGCRRYGARVVGHGLAYDDALSYARQLSVDEGLTYVQSFDDPLIAAGQASVAWEILEDLPEVDIIVAPIGGGGLLAGMAGLIKTIPEAAARSLFPRRQRPLSDIRMIGVQASGAASTIQSVMAGQRLELSAINTIADGIAVRQPGAWTFEVIYRLADDFVTVSDEEMMRTVVDLALREKLVAEPAGAAAVAAVTWQKRGATVDLHAALQEGQKVVCVISGGNVESRLLEESMQRLSNPEIVLG